MKKIARAIAPFDFLLVWAPYFVAGYLLSLIIPPGQLSFWQMFGAVFLIIFAQDLSDFIKKDLYGDGTSSDS